LKTNIGFEALQGVNTSDKGKLEKDLKIPIYQTKIATLLKDLKGIGVPHGRVKKEKISADLVKSAILVEKAEMKSYNCAKQKISKKIDLDKKYCKLTIFFATDRKEIELKNKIDFTGDRDKVTYGEIEITIPKDHRMGKIETPWFFRAENPKKHITVLKTTVLEKNIFFEDIKKLDKNKALIFIHGYNVSFKDAAKRTGQLAYDLNFKGHTAFYSWPSKAKETSYAEDKTNIEWSTENIKNFLIDFCEKSDVEKIYVIAHSMGNVGFTEAFKELKINKPSLVSRFEQIILTAPDIDSDIFRDRIAPKIVGSDNPITLYTSSNDLALKCSERYNGYKRAGDSTDIIVLNGIETIDASNVDTNFMGHSYYGDETSVISDIFNIINNDLRANERPCLEEVNADIGLYWKFKK
jgi:esterase/lipase superfamily enzyme